jgi:hypothetical protein
MSRAPLLVALSLIAATAFAAVRIALFVNQGVIQ